MKSSSRHILWERSAISLKDMSDIFLSAGDENGGIRREDRLGRDIEVDAVACFYAEDVQVMPAADIKLDDAFPFPCFWYGYFVDGVFVAEREVVEDMLGTAADGRPKRELALRVDGFVRAVPQQEFFVNVARGARYDIACAKFFEKRGCFEGALGAVFAAASQVRLRRGFSSPSCPSSSCLSSATLALQTRHSVMQTSVRSVLSLAMSSTC